MEHIKRKLVAILSADVKDYSRLMQDNEAETVSTLNKYKTVMERLIIQHHGRVVDSPGDNLLAEFASVVDATQGAVAIQRELKVLNDALPRHRQMAFRMGINLGDVICEDDRIYGDGVNIAARLEGLSEPGGICISRTAHDQIEDKLPLGYEYMGERQVKNAAKPVRAYKVVLWPESGGWKTVAGKLGRRQRPEPDPEESPPEEKPSDWRSRRAHIKTRRREKTKARFARHIKVYLGIIGFLTLINILTYSGVIWCHWPALGWGFFLYLHWVKASSA